MNVYNLDEVYNYLSEMYFPGCKKTPKNTRMDSII